MIESIIRWSISNRVLVLFFTVLLIGLGLYSVQKTPIDAIPDLSDVQVIVKTSYAGQAPQVVQDQVTYPISSAMLSVPGAKTVRGFSFYGDSYVYIVFEDGVDPYWARSRVQEYLSQAVENLPQGVVPQLGPDASGVGWVYIYALSDSTGKHDISQLRSLQDWFLKHELQAVPGVSEVAAVGGMVKQYQVTINPEKLRAFNIPLHHITTAIQRGNQELGASVIEMAEAEYRVRVLGYIKNLQDLENIPLGIQVNGSAVLLKHIADIQLGPQMRRAVVDLNGKGESVGGIVVMRHGENASQTIDAIKNKLESLKKGLPEGVELVPVYDRSTLIKSAITNLWTKLIEELVIVVLVCAIFLFHFRSSLVAILSLPVGILMAFTLMSFQGLNANVMSLGGIAIAVGTMIDGAIVMIENMHKKMEQKALSEQNRWQLVSESAIEVGPALFFSLLIITVSFLPVLTLEAQEGKMFSPLAYTKTYAMAAAAFIAITLVPVLMGYLIRGKVVTQNDNRLMKLFVSVYRYSLSAVLSFPKSTLFVAVLVFLSVLWPLSKIGSEFMPELDEGDLMYMPTTYPSISIGKAREILQQTDRLISTVPEVKNVFGKVGRADTATDPAPLTMIETFIQLKPKSEWREGLTSEKLKSELDALVKFPGLSNAWVMPIKTRIDMLATGIKTPVGIKIAGPDLKMLDTIGAEIETLLSGLDTTASVYSERLSGGRYLDIDIRRDQAARYNLNIADVQEVVSTAVGGRVVANSVEGLERYPINVRYPQDYRDTPEALERLPIVTDAGSVIALGDIAEIKINDGPPGIKSENARLVSWVLVDIKNTDVGSYVKNAEALLNAKLQLPAGYSVSWSGQFEYMARAKEKLQYVVPLTLALILVLLYINFRSFGSVALILATLPLSLVGSLWLMHLLGFNFSVAVAVGFIALAGVVVEIGVIMLVYLDQAMSRLKTKSTKKPEDISLNELKQAVLDGASQRLRPVLMTSFATIAGLLPIMYSDGVGSEIMQRQAAPMVGGMISALLLTLFILPTLYFLITRYNWKRQVV